MKEEVNKYQWQKNGIDTRQRNKRNSDGIKNELKEKEKERYKCILRR